MSTAFYPTNMRRQSASGYSNNSTLENIPYEGVLSNCYLDLDKNKSSYYYYNEVQKAGLNSPLL